MVRSLQIKLNILYLQKNNYIYILKSNLSEMGLLDSYMSRKRVEKFDKLVSKERELNDLVYDLEERYKENQPILKGSVSVENEFLKGRLSEKSDLFLFSYLNEIAKIKKGRAEVQLQKAELLKSEDVLQHSKKKMYADFIVFNSNSEFLILRRTNTGSEFSDKWCLPGGHVDRNESFRAAAFRELQEETGIVIDHLYGSGKYEEVGIYKDDKVEIHYFSTRLDSVGQILLQSSEHVDYAFISFDQMDQYDLIANLAENLKKLYPSIEQKPKVIQKSEDLEKSNVHKYISKEPDGHGGWRYKYREDIGGSSSTPSEFIEMISSSLEEKVQDIIGKYREHSIKNGDKFTSLDEEMIRLHLLSDMNNSVGKYIKQGDEMVGFNVTNSAKGNFNINLTLRRDGKLHYLNTQAIYAGGHNIQKLHYRYITDSSLPIINNKPTNLYEEKIKHLKGVEKLQTEIEDVRTKIELSSNKIDSMSSMTEDQILDSNKHYQSLKGVTWESIISRGADKNFDSKEAFENTQIKYRESIILAHQKSLDLEGNRRDSLTKSLHKLESKLHNLTQEGVTKSEEFDLGHHSNVVNTLEKAFGNHKYKSKKSDGKGGWIYTYEEEHNSSTKEVIDNINEIIKGIEDGTFKIKRLSPEEEQGRIRGGSKAVGATILCGTVEGANSEDIEKLESRARRQEAEIIEYAKRYEFFESYNDVANPEKYIGEGAEAKVYKKDEESLYKIVDYKTLNISPLEYLDRLSLHNFLFPEAPYKLTGITEENGEFRFIVEQPTIKNATQTTKDEVSQYMKNLGYEDVGGNTYVNSDYIIEDLHGGNVLKRVETGSLVFIDPNITLNLKQDGFGGNRSYGWDEETIKSEEFDIEKAFSGKAKIGEIRTHSDGKKYKKVSETGNPKQDWQPVREGGEKSKEDDTKPKKEYTPEELAEFAKQASEANLQKVIKEAPDSKLREAAHKELDRRQKEEHVQKDKEEKGDREKKGSGEKESGSNSIEELKKKYKEAMDNDDFESLQEISKQLVENAKKVQNKEGVNQDKYKDERFTQNFSDEETDALDTYASIKFREINSQMRDGKISKENKKTVDLILSAMKKNKLKEDVIVYRGVGGNYDKSNKNSFTSTSTDKEVAKNFARGDGSEVREIKVPKGTPVAYMGGAERELILPPNWDEKGDDKKFSKSHPPMPDKNKSLYYDIKGLKVRVSDHEPNEWLRGKSDIELYTKSVDGQQLDIEAQIDKLLDSQYAEDNGLSKEDFNEVLGVKEKERSQLDKHISYIDNWFKNSEQNKELIRDLIKNPNMFTPSVLNKRDRDKWVKNLNNRIEEYKQGSRVGITELDSDKIKNSKDSKQIKKGDYTQWL